MNPIKVSLFTLVCSAVLSMQASAAPTAQMFEEVFNKTAADASAVAGELQEAYEIRNYDMVEAWMTFFVIFPEAVSTAPAIDLILNDWATTRPGLSQQIIEQAILAKTLARSALPASTKAQARARGLRPDLISWGDWRQQNPTKGYLSEKFKSEPTLPEAEVTLFNALAFLGDPTLEPTETWLKSHITQFGVAASGLKGAEFSSNLEKTLYYGGILTNVLSNPGYKPNLWSESLWGTEVPKFARAIFNAKNDIASLGMQPSQSKTLVDIEKILNNLSGVPDSDALASFRTKNYSKKAPLFFSYVWPSEGQHSLLNLLDTYAVPNIVRPQTTNALNFLKSSADYLQNNSQHPNRYLSTVLLSQSDINAGTFASRPEGTYDLPEPGNDKPAWLRSLQGLSTTFALNYHSGYNCQDFKGNGFDVTYNKNPQFSAKFKENIPAEYLPHNGDVTDSGDFHKRFVRCEPLVGFYKHSMSILLTDMKRAKDKLVATNSSCTTSWEGHDSQASQSCPLYITAGMVSNESQASAIYSDESLKRNWFAFLSNNPQDDLRDTQLKVWSRDPEGIQGQVTCRLWLEHTQNLNYSQAVLDNSFVMNSFEDTTGFLFTLGMAYKDLTAGQVGREDFAQYTSDVNQASDACTVVRGGRPVPMPTHLYSRAYELATGLAHITPLH